MKKYSIRQLLLLWVLVLMLLPSLVSAQAKPLVELDIYSVNDFHGALRQEGRYPGIATVAGVLTELGKINPEGTILLGGGDMLTGNLDADEYQGLPVVYAMNQIGFTANVLGNHAFDGKPELLQKQISAAVFPMLSANVLAADGTPAFTPYTMLNRSGIKIAVVGITTLDTLYKANPGKIRAFQIVDPVTSAQKYINEARAKGAQVVILLAHCGSHMNERGAVTGEVTTILDQLQGVDACVSAHSHERVFGEYKKIPVVQAEAHGMAIGKIHLLYSRPENKIIASNQGVVSVAPGASKPDSNIAKMVEPILKDVDKKYGEILGTNANYLSNDRQGVSAVGEYVADLLRKGFGADVALLNGGMVRHELEPGTLTARHLREVLPFSSEIVVMQLTGADLLAALEHGIDNPQISQGRFSGVRLAIEPDLPQGQRICDNVLLDGTRINPTALYKVVTVDFIAAGGDNYTMLLHGTNKRTVGNLQDFFTFAVRSAHGINYHEDGRLSVGQMRQAA